MSPHSRGRTTRAGPPHTVPPVPGGTRAAPGGEAQLRVSPRKALLTVVALAVALVCAALAVGFVKHHTAYPVPWNLERMFYLGGENNLPTYFSSVVLLACGVLLFLIYRVKAQSRERYAMYWAGLSLVFLYLSADEAASLHELSTGPVQRLTGATGALRAAWVIPGTIAVTAFTLLYLRFLLALPAGTRNRFILAGGLYVGGAIGLEMLSWRHRDLLRERNPDDWEASKDLTYELLTTGEEALEMAGVIVFLHALLSYLAAGRSAATVRFGPPP